MIKIGLLGFGTVGHASYTILNERKEFIEKALGQEVQIVKILVRSIEKYRMEEASSLMTTDVDEIVEDSSIDVIIELTGGVDTMIEPIIKAMKSKKHIITANKALVSKYMEDLLEYANENKVAFQYEAAVAGTVPIIDPMKQIALLNDVSSIRGVLNGTCNFILQKMEEGMDYDQALREAQELGFAEADPTADVEGYDTMRKIRILASMAFHEPVVEDDIDCTGISHVSKEDVQEATKEGKRIKLIAHAQKNDQGIDVHVRPEAVDKNTILGRLENGENAVVVNCSNAGELVFEGLGAGGRPTAFSVLSDLLHIYK